MDNFSQKNLMYDYNIEQIFLNKPVLLMIVGVAGSGKTTLGHELAKRISNSVFLSKDMLQDSFISTERRGNSLYEFIRGPTFDILLNFADVQLSHGKTPIIEGPFSKNFQLKDRFADWPGHFRKIATDRNTQLLIIRCKPSSSDDLKERLKQRGFARDKSKLDGWDEWAAFEPIDFPIPHDNVYDLITDKPLNKLIDLVIEKISTLQPQQ